MIPMTDRLHSVFLLAPWVHVRILFLLMVLVFTAVLPAVAVHSQGANLSSESGAVNSETVETVTGHVSLTETSRKAWNLSESDWQTYTSLMRGPSGIWYPGLSPAAVLGINASTDAERDRFARIVFEQERRRLDQLFDFNRAYARIARAERSQPGFGYFGEFEGASGLAGLQSTGLLRSRLIIFVGQDCPACDRAVQDLTRSRRPFDVYYTGASSDAEIQRWARRIRLPTERVRDRTITLNHDTGLLSRAGRSARDLPILFRDPSLANPVALESVLTQ